VTQPASHPGLPAGGYWVLIYEYVDDMAAKRYPVRPGHLDLIARYRDAGELVNAGAVGDPPAGGLLVFAPDARDAAERFVAEDPYGHAGLITGHRIEPWTVVG
jgi:uncharacterized protein